MVGATQLFERPRGGERAVLVGVGIGHAVDPHDTAEFKALAASAGTLGVGLVLASRPRPDPRYFVGAGKAEEIRACAEQHDADVVLIDQTLSPSQERNLEKLTNRRVLDRNGLIFDIFAQRARSFEGKLQVELAQLSHLSTRLVRGWTHLERQKGGIGLRGPGETQLETDRRLIAKRIRTLRARLEKLDASARPAATCGARFRFRRSRWSATPMPASRRCSTRSRAPRLTWRISCSRRSIRRCGRSNSRASARWCWPTPSDSFARLPHELIAAFRSTLQEARDADLLLHVVDASDPLRNERIEQVREVLRGIGAGKIRELHGVQQDRFDWGCGAARSARRRPAERRKAAGRSRRRRRAGAGVDLGGNRRRA